MSHETGKFQKSYMKGGRQEKETVFFGQRNALR